MDNKWKRNGTRKLWVDISEDLYEELKKISHKRNIKFTTLINRILIRSVITENKYEGKQVDVIETDCKKI